MEQPVRRIATELAPEDLQSEFARYGIAVGDSNSRFTALQERYDEEYDNSILEYETVMQKLEMQRTKQAYQDALSIAIKLEQEALDREPKAATIVRQIKANVAPQRLVVRGISPLSCCALFRAMRNNSNVISLDVSNNALSDMIGAPIGNMLAANKKLRALDVGFNKLTSVSLLAIGEALRVNSVLTSLMLNSNQVFQLQKDLIIGNGGSGNPAGAAVANSSNAKLSTGSSPSKFPPHLAAAFAQVEPFTSALMMNTSLTTLNLFNTGISHEVGRALAHALAKNTSLISVDVGSNMAEAKSEQLVEEMKEQALVVHAEKAKEAKRLADAEWHDENARKRAEIREAEEWERARCTAEAEVEHLLNMEAENKKYLERLQAEKKPAKGKGKK